MDPFFARIEESSGGFRRTGRTVCGSPRPGDRANRVWIEGPHSRDLPESVLFASITKARELFAAGQELADASRLRRVIDLPADLDVFGGAERKTVDRFLRMARAMAADRGRSPSTAKLGGHLWRRRCLFTTYTARRSRPLFVIRRRRHAAAAAAAWLVKGILSCRKTTVEHMPAGSRSSNRRKLSAYSFLLFKCSRELSAIETSTDLDRRAARSGSPARPRPLPRGANARTT